MKKEVCLMCIVCFFLGYFVCDVIGKCGFKKPPPPPPHEHYGDHRDYRETEDFEAPKLSAQQLHSKRMHSEQLHPEQLSAQQLHSKKMRSEQLGAYL